MSADRDTAIMEALQEMCGLQDAEKCLHGEIIHDHALELHWDRKSDTYTISVRLVNVSKPHYQAEYKNVKVPGEIIAEYRKQKNALILLGDNRK